MSTKTVREVDTSTFDEVVKTERGPVVVDMTAEWCGPCHELAPVLEQLAAEGEYTVVAVDVDQHPDLARRLEVMSMPTFLVYRDGTERGRLVGARPLGRLRHDLAAILA